MITSQPSAPRVKTTIGTAAARRATRSSWPRRSSSPTNAAATPASSAGANDQRGCTTAPSAATTHEPLHAEADLARARGAGEGARRDLAEHRREVQHVRAPPLRAQRGGVERRRGGLDPLRATAAGRVDVHEERRPRRGRDPGLHARERLRRVVGAGRP